MKTIFSVFLFLFILLGCSSDNNTDNSIPQEFKYPLYVVEGFNMGNYWQYEGLIISENQNSSVKDTLSYFLSEIGLVDTVTISDSLKGIVLVSEYSKNDSVLYSGYQFIFQDDYSLRLYGTNGNIYGSPSFKKSSKTLCNEYYNYCKSYGSNSFKRGTYEFWNNSFGAIEDIFVYIGSIYSGFSADSVVIYDVPKDIYKYPWELGREWSYDIDDITVKKKVNDWKTVTVQPGDFSCYEVVTELSKDDETEKIYIYDYVSFRGLIKRRIEIENITSSDKTERELKIIQEYNLVYAVIFLDKGKSKISIH